MGKPKEALTVASLDEAMSTLRKAKAFLQAQEPAEVPQAKPEVFHFLKRKPKKTKVAKATYKRVDLPEGWKLIPGLNAIRTDGYNAARAEHPTKPYGFWNREGLLRVQEALATM